MRKKLTTALLALGLAAGALGVTTAAAPSASAMASPQRCFAGIRWGIHLYNYLGSGAQDDGFWMAAWEENQDWLEENCGFRL